MKELVLIIRPESLEQLKQILDELNCGGMTVTNAMGCGAQKGFSDYNGVSLKGIKIKVNLLPKIRVSVVVPDDMVENIIDEVLSRMSDGQIGDGKIFVKDVADVIRIRTGERGIAAL